MQKRAIVTGCAHPRLLPVEDENRGNKTHWWLVTGDHEVREEFIEVQVGNVGMYTS